MILLLYILTSASLVSCARHFSISFLFLAIFTVNLFSNFILFEIGEFYLEIAGRNNEWNQLFYYALIYKEDFYRIHFASSSCLLFLTTLLNFFNRLNQKPGPLFNHYVSLRLIPIMIALVIFSEFLPAHWVTMILTDAIYFSMLVTLICVISAREVAVSPTKIVILFFIGFAVTIYISYDNSSDHFNRGAIVKYTLAMLYGFYVGRPSSAGHYSFAALAAVLAVVFASGARLIDADSNIATDLKGTFFDVLIAFEHTIIRNVQILNEFDFDNLSSLFKVTFINSFSVLVPMTAEEKGLSQFVAELYVAAGHNIGGFASGMLFQGAVNYGVPVGLWVGIIISFSVIFLTEKVINIIRAPILRYLFGIYMASIVYDFYRYDLGVILRKMQYSLLVIGIAYFFMLVIIETVRRLQKSSNNLESKSSSNEI